MLIRVNLRNDRRRPDKPPNLTPKDLPRRNHTRYFDPAGKDSLAKMNIHFACEIYPFVTALNVVLAA